MRKNMVRWAKKHTNEPSLSLAHFTRGGFIFAVGMMTIILAEKLIETGVQQEIIALFGLLITLLGGSFALWGYLGISLFKILIYIFERDDDDSNST